MLNRDKVHNLRKKYISPSFSLSYWKPLYITRGKGQYLYDDKGKKYLDAINNIQHVGHSHPKVYGISKSNSLAEKNNLSVCS